MEMIERQNRARQLVEEKLRDEANTQYQHEAEVAQMEREELELIMRLKNTKLLEDAAQSELDKAHTDPNPDPQSMQRQQKSASRSSKMGSKASRR